MFIEGLEKYLGKGNLVNFAELSTCDAKVLKLQGSCNSVLKYFENYVPIENYEIEGTTFMKFSDIISMNYERYPAHLAFPFGYICFAKDTDGEAWVFDKKTGKVMKVTYEAFSDEDYIIDINNDLEELEYNQANFHKGFNELDIYTDLDQFFRYNFIEHKFANGVSWD
ncbi:MAG: hypothetical protein NE330_17860 [Lentisphaeraceae bacterium]|nr:hypothetical protein [Lentisphaeraceae bacterium]